MSRSRCDAVELAVDAVKRVRDRMSDLPRSGGNVCRSKMLSRSVDDLGVLRFGNSPDQQIDFAWVLRKIRRNLLADKRILASPRFGDSPRSCRDR